MTIEKSPAPTSPQAANRTDNPGAKGKSNGADEGGGGFTAILGALDAAPASSDAPAATDPNADNSAGSGNGVAAAPAVDPNLLLQQNPQIAAAQALQAAADAAAAAAAAAQGGAAPGKKGAAATGPVAMDPAALAQQAGAAPTQLPGQVAALPGAAARAAGRGMPGMPGAADAGSVVDSTQAGAPSAAQALLQARAKASKEALQAGVDSKSQAGQAGQTSGQAGNQASATERADAAKFMAALEQAQSPQTGQAGRALESALAPLLAKTDKPQTERSSTSAKGVDPTYSGSALGVSGPDFSQTAAQPGAVAPEMQVAEQVSYWVSQNVQNAELKLDGLGQTPVAVNISVQGNEAHISFRSDDLATRDMLENSGAHLKDMLQREGLVLTGVSVGTSGSGDAQGREQRTRQNVRQGVIAPLQVASQDSTARLRSAIPGSAGRSVDLFV